MFLVASGREGVRDAETDRKRDERSNSSLCLFYLFNEQSATHFNALEFTQRTICSGGNSTRNPPASESNLN